MIREMTLKSRADGLGVSVIVVTPEETPHAVIQLSHGVCGCKERFLPFMNYMAGKGIACVAGDHRGHGASVRSADDLGYMYEGGYMALVDDMRMITEWTRGTFPDTPLYLLGHSMGSLAARVYTKYDDSSIDGLILTGSPSWNPFSRVGRLMAWILCAVGLSHHRMKMVQKMTSAGYNRRFRSEGDQAWTCSDVQVRREFADNPLCNFTLTANGSYNLMCMMEETYGQGRWNVSNPSMPVVFISGSEDPTMVSERKFHKSAQNFCDRGYTNVTSAIYPAMRHEVLNEVGKEEIWDDILDFMGLNTSGR